jgi:hypothetical protein
MGADTFATLYLKDGPRTLPEDADVPCLDQSAIDAALTDDGYEVEGRWHRITEIAPELARLGYTGELSGHSMDDGEHFTAKFRPGRSMWTSGDWESNTLLSALADACWRQTACDSCAHQLECNLGQYHPRWEPRADRAGATIVPVPLPPSVAASFPNGDILGLEPR